MENQPAWEKAKENVCPAREGRDVAVLNAALTAPKSDLDKARAIHEVAVKEAKRGYGIHAQDPLAPCVAYVKWVLEHYPAGSPLLIQVVEDTCRRFAKQPRYIDDPRLTRLWVRYACMRTDKLDVFQYMRDRRIGETSALFYEAWAASLELARDYNLVEKVYRLGREKRANPSERLAQREREFYCRMSARNRRAEKRQQEKEVRHMIDTQRAERRTQGDSNVDPIMAEQKATSQALLASGDTVVAPKDATDARKSKVSVRPALGTLTEDEARTGYRPMANKGKVPFSVSKKAGKPVGNKMPEPVKIFVDVGKPNPSVDAVVDGDGLPKRVLPRKDEVSKEDEGRPTKWAGETLVQDSALKRRRGAHSAKAATIEIYEGSSDDDKQPIQESAAENERKGGSETQLPAKRRPFTILGESDRDDDNDEDDTVEKPLTKREKKETRSVLTVHRDGANADENGPPPNATSPTSSAVGIPPSGLLLSPQDPMLQGPPSPTINTKLAMKDVDDVFNTTVAMERNCTRALKEMVRETKKPLGCGNAEPKEFDRIQVFREDTNRLDKAANGKCKAEKIEVFIDEDGDKENNGRPRAEASLVRGPAGIPALEERLFRPISELESVVADEGPNEVVVLDEVDIQKRELTVITVKSPPKHDDTVSPAMDSEKMSEFIASVKKEDNFYTLKSEDPDSFQAMFDLVLDDGDLITLDPCLTHYGASDKSFVLLVEDMNDFYGLGRPSASEDSDDEEHPRVAMKVSDPSNIWEFFIYTALASRRAVRSQSPAMNIPNVLSFIEGSTHSYLIMDTASNGSLTDVYVTHNGAPVSESVCLLFAIDLLRALEGVHAAGIIHNDVTLDNVLIRSDLSALDGTPSEAYSDVAWKSCGIMLVDFNQAIDSRHFLVGGSTSQAVAEYMKRKGANFRTADYAIQGAEQWGFNIDCYGAAVCIAKLLDVSVRDDLTVSGRGLKYASLWKQMFVGVGGLGALTSSKETVTFMRHIRGEMEIALSGEASLSADFRKVMRTLEMLQSKRERENLKWS